MSVNTEKIIESIISKIELVNANDIPSIDLYMDQVTTFMENHLSSSKRHEDDKILTKTMINNYAKNDLLPSPEKKRYSKEHVLMLVFIYYFKNILSINDIKTILNPIADKYFHNKSGLQLEDIYKEMCKLESNEIEKVQDELQRKMDISKNFFSDIPAKDKDFLQLFSLICMLSYDVYIKKQLIEGIIDSIGNNSPTNKKEKKKNKSEDK